MATKLRLIRPPDPRCTLELKERTYGRERYTCLRYNGGEWIPDDGKLDLAFVVNDNGWPFAYGAEWPNWWLRSDTHPNNHAYRRAMEHCVSLYHVANGRRVEPVEVR